MNGVLTFRFDYTINTLKVKIIIHGTKTKATQTEVDKKIYNWNFTYKKYQN